MVILVQYIWGPHPVPLMVEGRLASTFGKLEGLLHVVLSLVWATSFGLSVFFLCHCNVAHIHVFSIISLVFWVGHSLVIQN
jgi:hypothetical protein